MPEIKHTYPDPAEQPTCVLLFVPIELAPLVGGLFRQMENPREWATLDDWHKGYKSFVELQDQLMSTCVSDLIAELRALRGVKPEYVATPIEERTTDMYQSFTDIRGVLSDGWFETPVLASLADIVKAERGNDADIGKGLWDDISEIISDASGLASIASFVTNLLNTAEETVVQGGLLTALVALTAANTAMMQQMLIDNADNSAKVNAILLALRGDSAPEDNVLKALRGTTDASSTRNVADLLE
jgi:hypothetical protein